MQSSFERRAVGAGSIVAALVLCGATMSAQSPPLELILSRAARYVDDFVDRFSNVVTEERYVQSVSGLSQLRNRSDRHRELRSDFLLVKPSDSSPWLPFRDVFEVDGAPVRDREERLSKMFLQSSSNALNRARELAVEAARYNLAGNALLRTVNNPLVTLAFLDEENQKRFRFQLGRPEPDLGPTIRIVAFRELARPTFIKGAFDADLPARGRFWIDAETGRIVRAELVLSSPIVSATLTTLLSARRSPGNRRARRDAGELSPESGRATDGICDLRALPPLWRQHSRDG